MLFSQSYLLKLVQLFDERQTDTTQDVSRFTASKVAISSGYVHRECGHHCQHVSCQPSGLILNIYYSIGNGRLYADNDVMYATATDVQSCLYTHQASWFALSSDIP